MLSKKKCKLCKKPVKEEFHFCPYCGEYLRSDEEFFSELDKLIEQEFSKLEKLFGMPIPRIKIYPKTVKTKKNEVQEKQEFIPKQVEEPQVEEIESNGEKIIRIKLPGVKEESNIEIKKLEESIEIRAKCGDKMYFKIIPVSPRKLYKTDFENEELVLLVGK